MEKLLVTIGGKRQYEPLRQVPSVEKAPLRENHLPTQQRVASSATTAPLRETHHCVARHMDSL
jgi:hypothetical protein